MKNLCKIFVASLFLLFGTACQSDIVDDAEFSLYYYSISDVAPGSVVTLTPSYIGSPPTDFRVYSITRNGVMFYTPKLDGELSADDCFYIDNRTGRIVVTRQKELQKGVYSISLSCVSAGKEFRYPDIITVKIQSDK